MLQIKEIPKQERPRERFLQYSQDYIQTHELIAILLRTGSRRQSAIELAKHVLYQYGSLKALSQATIDDLIKINGIGTSKAIELKAAFELGKRLVQEPYSNGKKLTSPEAIYHYLKDSFALKTQEHLIALYLNTKGELIKKQIIFIGSLNSSLVHPREIFKYAVLHSAASLIIAHNHPSGDPTPSKQDIDVTKIIEENSKMMDILLLDHVIIGRDRYFSFKEKGII